MKRSSSFLSTSTSSSNCSSGSGDSDYEIQKEGLKWLGYGTFTGIAVKHLENVPFSSTLCAFLDLDGISLPISTKESYKLRRKMKTEVKEIGFRLCSTFGLFDWEKVALGIGDISKKDLLITSSFTNTFGWDKKLKCILNLQIKFKRSLQGEQSLVLVNMLPLNERLLRANLIFDLARILQHQLRVLLIKTLEERAGSRDSVILLLYFKAYVYIVLTSNLNLKGQRQTSL